MAEALVDREELRKYARWWEVLPARVQALEAGSLREDRTIRRLTGNGIERNRDLRRFVELVGIEAGDLLVYAATADGRFGRYELAAIFLWPPDVQDPQVHCLDGPRGAEASKHRHNDTWLCLYYEKDPVERRWTPEHGLRRLFDLARRHVVGEHICRTTAAERWPIEEAPHGETEPAAPDPSLALPPTGKPGRNERCPCGSGRKSKKCCWQ